MNSKMGQIQIPNTFLFEIFPIAKFWIICFLKIGRILNTNITIQSQLEVFYLNSTLNFGIPPVLVFQLEVCYRVDRLLTGITAQQKGPTARLYSNKTSLVIILWQIQFLDWKETLYNQSVWVLAPAKFAITF